MKRNILTAGLVALIGCCALIPGEIAAKKQQRVLGDGSLPMVKGIDKNDPMVQARARRGAQQLNGLRGVRSGELDLSQYRPLKERKAYTRSMTDPRGHFIGGVGSYSEMERFDQAFIGYIDAKTGNVESLMTSSAICNGNDYDLQGGFLRNGIYYTPVTMGSEGEVAWNRFDIENRTVLSPIYFDSSAYAYAYSMTYNEAEDLVYCLSIDLMTGADNMLVVFNPAGNFELESAVNLNNSSFVGALAYNPKDQQVYAFDDSGRIFIVESGRPNMLQVGQFEGAEIPIEGKVSNQVAYSPLDGCFAMVLRDPVRKIISLAYFSDEDDPDGMYSAWELMNGAELGSPQYQVPYFIALCCVDAYATNDATELPATPVIDFEKNNLTGTITVTVPSYYYSGASIPATEKVHLIAAIDGDEVISGDFAPGSEQKATPTLTQGQHTLTVKCLINNEESPVRTVKFYTGNDNPAAVTDLRLTGTTLSWTAPGGIGTHNGYVDTEALTYDIYFGNNKQNKEPVKETSFTITPPADLAYTQIRVTATANGVSSAPASINQVIGQPMQLPVLLEPTIQESDLFQTIDANHDDEGFYFDRDTGKNIFRCFVGYYSQANDWLYLPVINFPTTDHLYNLAFTYANAQYEGSENLDIYLTKDFTTDTKNMVNIFRQRNLDSSDDKYYSLNFGIPEAGAWYIAFHCTSNGGAGGGVSLSEFAVNSIVGSSAVPGDAEDVKFTPAPLGALSTRIDLKAPTKSIIGKDLDKNEDVTFTIVCGNTKVSASAKPGETASAEVEVSDNGYNNFKITPSNANGEGLTREYRAYVGVDRPLCPTNIKVIPAANNTTIDVTWNAPGDKGENGGYVDVDNLKYRIYNVTGIAYNEVGVTSKLNYRFNVGERQDIYNVGPAAFNEVGESRYSQFIADILGKPYLLPMVEEFGNSGFSYEPFYLNLTPPYENCAMQSIQSVLSPTYQHGCRQDCENGALLVYNTSRQNCPGQLRLPKFSTTNVDNASFTLRIIDFKYCPDVSLYARCDGSNDLELIGKFNLNKPDKGEWVDAEIPLPTKYLNKGWVQCVLQFDLTPAEAEYAFIDGYTVSQNIDTDLGIKSITGSQSVFTGETYSYSINLVNGGKDLIRAGQGDIDIRLRDKDGKQLTHQNVKTPRVLSLSDIFLTTNVPVLENYTAVSPITLEVNVTLPDDEVAWNNSSSIVIDVRDNEAPVVRDLTGKWDDDYSSISMSWTEPDLDHTGYDGFELLQGFDNGEKLNDFVNVDMDKAIPFCFDGLRWEGDSSPMGWQVIDTDEVYPWKNDPRLGAHSGHKYLMARNPSYDLATDLNKTQSADWLISPEVVPGSDISFWYGTPDSSLTEYIELWVSSTDDTLGTEIVKKSEETSVGATCGSFRYVRTFSKSGEEAWEYVKEKLPDDAKYFALVYRSIDGFAALLDDLTYQQAKKSYSVLDHYAIWTLTNDDWKTWSCVADDLHTTSYTDTKANKDATNTFYVITYVKSGDSFIGGPISNPLRIFGQGVEATGDVAGKVSGGKEEIIVEGMAGSAVSVYSTDGKLVAENNMNDEIRHFSVAPGVYVVRIGKLDFKVLVK